MVETKRLRISHNRIVRPYEPVSREVSPMAGLEVEIIETAGDTAHRSHPPFEGCYGIVQDTGADPSLLLVRVAGRGAAWVKRWKSKS